MKEIIIKIIFVRPIKVFSVIAEIKLTNLQAKYRKKVDKQGKNLCICGILCGINP